MGITGLWKASHSFIAPIWTLGLIAYQQIFAPIANETSFHQLAVTEGFTANVGGVRVLRVGVDARCLVSLFFTATLRLMGAAVPGSSGHRTAMDTQRTLSSRLCLCGAHASSSCR